MPRQLAHDILSLIDRAPRADDRLELSGGDDPVFPSPWRVGRAGAAALGAVGLATSDLWRLRTGRAQSVAVNLRAAAASLRSNTYVTQNGEKPVSWDPLAGHYKTRDGRTMFLHTNHPHHRAGALRISGAKVETREALAEAVAKWDGLAIEEAIADGGCVGGLVRSRDEWDAHPRGQAVARLPLLDIVKIGEAPAEPLPKSGDRPLAGVRALDLTRVLAGPTSGRVLAENGAEVLHVAAPHLPYQTEILMDTGHGKRCAVARKPGGRSGRRRSRCEEEEIDRRMERLGGLKTHLPLLAVMSPTSCRRAVPSITREVIKGRFYPPSRATLRRQRSRRIPCCRLNATCSTSHATSVS